MMLSRPVGVRYMIERGRRWNGSSERPRLPSTSRRPVRRAFGTGRGWWAGELHEVRRSGVVAEGCELLLRPSEEHALGEHFLDITDRHIQVLSEAEEARLHLD